jgi:uncharacterized membrane protein YuzA (DUF378 family)
MADVNDRYDNSTTYDNRPRHVAQTGSKNFLDWLSLVLLIVGGLNWGLVGLFNVDIVATLFGEGSMLSRVVYIAVGLAAIWGFALMRLRTVRT